MAKNVARIDGRAALAYQAESPFFHAGTRIESERSVASALRAANLDWDVHLEELRTVGSGQGIPTRRAVVRHDGLPLSVVSRWYEPIQYRDAMAIFQPAIDKFGLTIESAGATGQGERAWMLVKLPNTISPVDGDDVRGYGIAIAGHTGKTGFEFRPLGMRLSCQNQLDAIQSLGNKGRIFIVSHVGNVAKAMKDAADLVVKAIAAMEATGETFKKMAHRRMTPQELVTFIETVFPTPASGEVSDRLREKRLTVNDLIFKGKGADLALSATDGTPNPWAVYNAVTEYFDHVAPALAKKDTAVKAKNLSALFGVNASLKRLALDHARSLVAAN